jgi:uncharacterized protein YihD (DUF1040 family)
LNNISNEKTALLMRDFLRGFYEQLKENDRYIKFAFLTGISKFSKASIFSGLNQIKDISLMRRFGNICGYTQEELEFYFKDYLVEIDLENVKNLAGQKGIELTSIIQIEESINTLRNLQNIKPESGYESLLTSIKDNIMVVRNEIQSLKFDLEEQRKGATKIDVEKLKLAIKNAENINREAVKGDLISLIYAIKGEDESELRATMDKIALESKELTLILKDLLQKSSGVKR